MNYWDIFLIVVVGNILAGELREWCWWFWIKSFVKATRGKSNSN